MPLICNTGALTDKEQRAIRRGEYVDFKLLLPNPQGERRARKFTIGEGGYFEEVDDVSMMRLYEWWDAWTIFMSVRALHYPHKHQGLMWHQQIVKDLHNRGMDAVDYDARFRRLKDQCADVEWGGVPARDGGCDRLQIARLLHEGAGTPAHVPYRRRSAPPPCPRAAPPQVASIPACYDFNKTEGCRRAACRFRHACDRCGLSNHPRVRCRK